MFRRAPCLCWNRSLERALLRLYPAGLFKNHKWRIKKQTVNIMRVLFSCPSGGVDEKHQHDAAALPVHQARSLPQLQQVSQRVLHTDCRGVPFQRLLYNLQTLGCSSGSGWSSLSTLTSSETPSTASCPTTFSAASGTGEASRIT